ncbi:MAG: nuclear transport factor 2 family protein [Xenococcaceae cyanobacterium MO_234.B1]|nr:nuclear transport factor 2 family protein [Xenococcaceae cyanobacterium MO_234.B1]
MSHPNVAIIEKMWECFANGDNDTLRTLFSPDVIYRMPGYHPIAGTKKGIDELFGFFGELGKSNVKVDLVRIGALGEDMVVEVHHGYGETKGAVLDVTNCNVYQIKDSKIQRVDCYNGDQHAIDNFFNAIYSLKTIPERLAV